MKIKESQLRQIIRESLEKFKPEPFKGDDRLIFISHGEWADPEIEFNGEAYDYYDIEDCLPDGMTMKDATAEDIINVISDIDAFNNELNEGKKIIKEQIGSLDDVILCSDNNWRDVVEVLEWVEKALLKKAKRGIMPDREQLIDCSTLRRCQQIVVKRYSQEIEPVYLSNEEKREIREHFAERILDWLEYDLRDLGIETNF